MQEKIREVLKEKILESGTDRGQHWIKVRPEDIVSVVKTLKEGEPPLFDMITDICGVDNLPAQPRFQVVYHLLSTPNTYRLRIKVDVPQDSMEVPSLVSVWKVANWLEREAYDMYGIRFSGHPDLRRILMHEDFTDFPQRKDFPLKGWREEKD